MTDENIWEGLNLKQDNSKTVYDYLVTQTDNLKNATNGILEMYIEVVHAISTDNTSRPAIIYYVYIVAPYLGKFRKEILNVMEFPDTGRFPVSIFCTMDGTRDLNINEQNFLSRAKEILSKNIVKNTIENLYRQSIEAQKYSQK